MAYTVIDKPSDYFNTVLYTGNNTSQSITGVGFQPDWVWLKERNGTEQHNLYDSVRGVYKRLMSDGTNAEYSSDTQLTAFGSDGFSVGSSDAINDAGNSMVAWNWKIESGIFDIQTWTGNGSNRTIAHNLGVAPEFYLVKEIVGSANDWTVYYGDPTDFLILNESNATSDAATRWNDTAPTASVFSLGTATGGNRNGSTYIGYFFASKQGVSKIGTYTGNGNADGTFVYTGFKPAFVMVKRYDGAGQGWNIFDNKRDPFNLVDEFLIANSSNAEATGSALNLDFLSNGFKFRGTDGGSNTSGSEYIYMCFAENPFVTSTGIPATAR